MRLRNLVVIGGVWWEKSRVVNHVGLQILFACVVGFVAFDFLFDIINLGAGRCAEKWDD